MNSLKIVIRVLEPVEKLLMSLSLSAAFCLFLLLTIRWLLSQGL
jgi:hypothetical protein